MSDEELQRAHPSGHLTARARLELWRAFIKRWTEIQLSELDDDLADIDTGKYDVLEEQYVAAYWTEVIEHLLEGGPKRLEVPPHSEEQLDMVWLTVCRVFGIEPDGADTTTDVERRLEMYKQRIAKEFERSSRNTIA